MYDLRLGVGEWERSSEMCKLGRLLDGANRAHESGTARNREDPAQAPGSLGGRERGKRWDRRLDRRHLAEVDEAGQ